MDKYKCYMIIKIKAGDSVQYTVPSTQGKKCPLKAYITFFKWMLNYRVLLFFVSFQS